MIGNATVEQKKKPQNPLRPTSCNGCVSKSWSKKSSITSCVAWISCATTVRKIAKIVLDVETPSLPAPVEQTAATPTTVNAQTTQRIAHHMNGKCGRLRMNAQKMDEKITMDPLNICQTDALM